MKSKARAVRMAALSAALAMLLTSTTALADAGESTPASEFLPTVRDSAGLSTPVIASGRTVGTDGRGLGGTQVALYAWPPDEVMSSIKVGETVRVEAVAKATTDSAGRYTLRVDEAIDMSRFAAETDGWLDLQVVAVAPNGTDRTVHSFSVQYGESAGVPRFVDQQIALGGASEPRPRVAPTVDLTIKPGQHAFPGVQTGVIAENAPILPKACDYTLWSLYTPQWDLVGAAYLATSGVTAQFTYLSGASSSLGVGFSLSGAYGTWSASGTSSKSSTATITFPSFTGSGQYRYFDTKFQYGKYNGKCAPEPEWQTRVHSFSGGSNTRVPSSAPSATYCVPFVAGSSFEKTSSSATTWSNGMDMSPAIGIDLSTRTGYSTSAKMKFTFSSTRNLCGTSGYPGGTPGQMVAKA